MLLSHRRRLSLIHVPWACIARTSTSTNSQNMGLRSSTRTNSSRRVARRPLNPWRYALCRRAAKKKQKQKSFSGRQVKIEAWKRRGAVGADKAENMKGMGSWDHFWIWDPLGGRHPSIGPLLRRAATTLAGPQRLHGASNLKLETLPVPQSDRLADTLSNPDWGSVLTISCHLSLAMLTLTTRLTDLRRNTGSGSGTFNTT